MKEERKVGRKKEGGEDLSLRSRLIKRFPLDLDWQHLNAHTEGYCLRSLKAKTCAIYFETAFVVDLLDVGCLLSTKENKKKLKWGLFHCSHFLFVSISK